MFEKLINWLAKKEIAKVKFEEYAKYELKKTQDEELKDQLLQDQLKDAVGKKIIYCPNEWTDPLFGTVTGITHVTLAKQPMLVCLDAITGEDSLVHPNSFYYADELLTLTILKLNPFERWNMSVGKLSHMTNMWSKRYPPKELPTQREPLEAKLREVGFLFKDKSSSNWLVERVSTFSYQNYELFLSKEPGVFKIRYRLKGNSTRTRSLTFSSSQEMEEFKQILGF